MSDKPSKIVAVMSGDDWSDAGVIHLTLPADADLAALRKEYMQRKVQKGETW